MKLSLINWFLLYFSHVFIQLFAGINGVTCYSYKHGATREIQGKPFSCFFCRRKQNRYATINGMKMRGHATRGRVGCFVSSPRLPAPFG